MGICRQITNLGHTYSEVKSAQIHSSLLFWKTVYCTASHSFSRQTVVLLICWRTKGNLSVSDFKKNNTIIKYFRLWVHGNTPVGCCISLQLHSGTARAQSSEEQYCSTFCVFKITYFSG